jgi:hypothetical protein
VTKVAFAGCALLLVASCRTSVSEFGRETLYGLDFPDAALVTDGAVVRDAPGDASDAVRDASADGAESELDATEAADSAPPAIDGTSRDAGCVPTTCADLPVGTCGNQGDGCGGLTGLCATCAPPEFCGGGGLGICGLGNQQVQPDGAILCTPSACEAGLCGFQSDGCGNLLLCQPCDAQ